MSILLGFLIHIVFLLSIFDIYFKSPVINGISEYHPDSDGPASRLVLFSADGLRAESLLKSSNAPYLKSVMKNRGIWGISNTRVPTESRPGHVAIIAGFYEDPSAIAKGWKENPVDFDSVFNQSYHTWSWGSPDILPMFAKGATGDHIDTTFYSHEEEDFSGKISTSNLDTWVFNKVEEFFSKAKENSALRDKLSKDKIVLFLHLLGLDTAGHTHKPHSWEYEENIKVVNDGVKKIEQIIEEYFDHDNKTAYIFTADHGMTDWGSHGAGDDHETKTPLIAWGAGIAVPDGSLTNAKNAIKNGYFKSVNRKDVNQADICPLMATLIGVPIPVNSVGVLPESYFGSNTELKAKSLHSNARQMIAQYDRKREIIEKHVIKLIYKPFIALTRSKVKDTVNYIDELLKDEKYEEVIKLSKETISLSLIGLEYYQNYYQKLLLICMTISFLGWIWLLLTVVLQNYESNRRLDKSPVKNDDSEHFKISIWLHILFGFVFSVVIFMIYVQDLPLQYNIYCGLPVLLWWKGLLSWKVWTNLFMSKDYNPSFTKYIKLFLTLLVYNVGLLILVYSFFHRWSLSIGLLGLALFPFQSTYRKNIPISLIVSWVLSCLALAGFSFLPVIGKNGDKHLVGLSGLFWFVTSLGFLFAFSLKLLRSGKESKKENLMMVFPPLMMLLAIQIKYFVAYQFDNKQGLSLICQVLSWVLTGISFTLPMFSSRLIMSRLFSIFSSLAVFFTLLSVSHEAIFLLFLSFNLLCWLSIEHRLTNSRDAKIFQCTFYQQQINFSKISAIDRAINSEDFRRSYIFMLYIILAFFGTGNIASINSFDPQWVRCFVSQFSPFLMAALILCKTLVPFLFVASTFCAINLVVKAPTGQLFLMVLVYSDYMGLCFLHLVQNTGSWLDIGTSISHYVIMETIVLFVSVLYGVGQILTSTSGWSIKGFLNKGLKMQ